MSGVDEGRPPGTRERLRKKREKQFYLAAVGFVVLIVVLTAVGTGALDPYPKKVILKASDMAATTGLLGHWEQTSLHCFEDDTSLPFGSLEAAHSIMYFYNETTHLAVAITVAEMANDTEANATYEEWEQVWTAGAMNITVVEIGDEGIVCGDLNESGVYEGSVWVHFRKGECIVEMYFDSNLISPDDVYEAIAAYQADRL